MTTWRTGTLGEEIELVYGKSLPERSRLAGPVQVFGSNGVVGTHVEASVAGPGIVVGRKGSVGEIAFAPKDFWPIDTTYYVVRKHDHNWRFLYHLLRYCDLTGLNSHSTIPGLNREDAYKIEVSLPDRDAEDDLASVLDWIEEAAQLESEAVDRTERLKAAAMQKLFSRGLRGEPQKESEIGPVPESWDLVEFGEVREFLQYGTSVRCTLEPSEHPVLRIPNIEPGRVNSTELKYCDLPSAEASKYVLEDGDLLFIRTNGVIERLGSCAVYEGSPEAALFASYLIRARLAENVLPKFAAYFYGSALGTSVVAGRATPASDGKYNLNTGTIDALPLPLPPTIEEQQEIVDVLDALDRKTDLHRRKHEVLDQLFESLLHKLMTGEVPVDDLDLTALPTLDGSAA